MNKYTISGSPHVHSTENTQKIMYRVILALIPALLVAIYYFGWYALRLTLVSVAACMLTEWLIQKFLIKGPLTINDGSAALTGLLLAFNVPANLPIWMAIVGSIVAIGVGKMAFGGLGKNPFNPALVGRVFMLVSFPTAMTTWPKATPIFEKGFFADAVTGPTPLGILKEAGVGSLTETGDMQFLDMVLGNRGGAFGEVCAIALLLGAIYLIARKVIDIATPLSILLTVFIFTGICHLVNPANFIVNMTGIVGLAGLLALVSVCVAERVESMFSAIVIPFAFYIMWSTVMMENNDGRFSVMEMLNPRQSVVFSRLQVVLMAVGGTLVIILWLFLKGRRKDVL